MNNREFTELVADAIKQKLITSGKKLILVGIEGKGCAGKSRMSHFLKDRLEELGIHSESVSIDDFCNPRSVRYNDGIALGLQVYFNNFDEDFFLKEVVEKAFVDQGLNFRGITLDVASDTYSNEVNINLSSGGVLLVEGLHILRGKYAKYFSYSVFLHISNEEQLKRALVRDEVERGKSHEAILRAYKDRLTKSYSYFVEHDNPLEYADIFVNYEDVENPKIINTRRVRRGFL